MALYNIREPLEHVEVSKYPKGPNYNTENKTPISVMLIAAGGGGGGGDTGIAQFLAINEHRVEYDVIVSPEVVCRTMWCRRFRRCIQRRMTV